jgi:hypothetical protein
VGNYRLYPEADALQRPLCSRFQARLTASVREIKTMIADFLSSAYDGYY